MSNFGALRSALGAGATFAALAVCTGAAGAQEAPPAAAGENRETQALAAGDVDLEDPGAALRRASISVREGAARFSAAQNLGAGSDPRRVELELAAGSGDLDISFAQRASLGVNDGLDTRGRSSELRIGRGLVGERENDSAPATYVFVASDNEALTWQPRGQSAPLALQDRVEVGDVSAGVTYQRNGVLASLAYVEREQSTQIGTQSFTQDESFTGLTVTMRR